MVEDIFSFHEIKKKPDQRKKLMKYIVFLPLKK